ncbi:hypothetical protein F5I97DRAFT_1928586 [Phlebopus sp. FC_14]|nr:hypothetical protein F5I97DRAFT_1928586 [Phlebopus sp. FC_14]
MLNAYSNGALPLIQGFIKKNLTVFKISPAALEDPELSSYIDCLLKDVLIKQQSQIKSKEHISELAKNLLGKEFMEVTAGQWACFAYLCLLMFEELVAESLARRVEIAQADQDDLADSEENADNGNNEREMSDGLCLSQRQTPELKPRRQIS